MTKRWPHVALTAVIAVAVAAWAIPHLGDGGPTGYASTERLGAAQGDLRVWIEGNSLLGVSLATHVDALAAQVMLLAAGVALLVQIYSTAYMGTHPRYRSYALLISVFLVAMVAVVAADDLFVLLIGWEVMGLCSYLLIGHEWQTPQARAGAAKAFLMTRFADLGLLIGILVIGEAYGTYRISEVLEAASDGTHHATAIGLLLLLAVVGKSAQFPLHTWLPDAMPGPTPITALIHAATMVAAGVYLMARMLPLFAESVVVMTTLAIVAAITMLMGALFALAQSDLKRALAWSTVSQLAFMFAALSTADRAAGTDHLLSHGVFKALLFLACGCLMHAVGTSHLADMGGLRRVMPVTFVTATIGFAALAGVVPTVGFFSKDSVLVALEHAAKGDSVLPQAVGQLTFYVALAAAFVTAVYATRLWLTAFFGEAKEAHEAPRTMTGPLLVLAAATFALSIGQPVHVVIGIISTLVAAAGIALVVYVWRRDGEVSIEAAPLERELALDAVYSKVTPTVVRHTARTVVAIDDDAVDSYSRGLARLAGWASAGLEVVQSRNVQRYASLIGLGAIALAVAAVIWS